MLLNSGDLNQRLTFKTPKEPVGGYPVPGHDIYAKAWGSLKTLKGSTRFAAAQAQMEHNREFLIRYQRKLLKGVRPTNLTVLWRDKEHEIESIEDDDGLRITMTVVLKAVT